MTLKIEELNNEIKKLSKEKNVSIIMKKYKEINKEISKLKTLVESCREELENEKFDNLQILNYEQYEKNLIELDIIKNNIENSDDLLYQIQQFKKLRIVQKECQLYIENKKFISNIIE